ncbi:MAG: DUF3298 domain-containing protein [Bacteroidetes bacterium]|nr:DUF3298 domain-containing protein [Bacteroidota bacterium]
MIRTIFIVLICACVLMGCTNQNTPLSDKDVIVLDSANLSQQPNAKIHLPISFYKKFEGVIGSDTVLVDLTKKDTVLTVTYFDSRIGENSILYGRVGSDGTFDLFAIYHKEINFSGSFSNETSISGIWTDASTRDTLKFSMSEKTDNVIAVSFEELHRTNCRVRDKMESSGNSNASDSICSRIDLDFIKVAASTQEATQNMNKVITSMVCAFSNSRDKCNAIDELMNAVDSIKQEDAAYQLYIGCSLVTNESDILCVKVQQSLFMLDAAHPSSNGFYCNFDIKTGKQLTLDDLIQKKYMIQFNKLAEKKFGEENGYEEWSFPNGKFKLRSDFAITNTGLLFTYYPDEIGSYILGTPQIHIPYEDFQNMIKPNGLIQELMKNRKFLN